jgi:prepilin-type processing-associated H-X9-DG protein
MLAGIVATRRYAWIPGTPPVLWGVALWITDLLDGEGVTLLSERANVTFPIGAALILGAFGYAGSRAAEHRRERRTAWVVLGGYVLAVIGFALRDELRDAVAQWGALAAVGGGLTVITFALYRDSRPGRLRAWAAGILCTVPAGVVIALACVPMFLHSQPGWTVTWRNVALAEMVLGVAALASFWGRRVRVGKRLPLPVLLAIVLVLGGVFVPAFGAVRRGSRQRMCVNNMHELIRAFSMYAADNDGSLLPRRPEAERYTEAEERYLVSSYAPYVRDADLWHCPSQPRPRTTEEGRAWKRAGRVRMGGLHNCYYRTYGYGWNERVEAPREFRGRRLILDVAVQDFWLIGAADDGPVPAPHGPLWRSHRNVGYLDGHVESLTDKERWQRIEEEGLAGLRGPRSAWRRPRADRSE